MSEGKLTKEELREDPVFSALMRFGRVLKEQGTILAVAVGVLASVLIIVQVMARSRGRAEQQAAVLLLNGEQQYQSGNLGEALRRFQEASDKQGSAPSGKMALLRAADCQLEMGQLEDAKRLYQKFLDHPPKDGLLRASGLRGMAGTLESMGQREESAKLYMEAAGIADSPLRPDDLVSAGTALIAAGKGTEAIAAFQKCIELYPESPKIREAREGLEAAKARSGSSQ